MNELIMKIPISPLLSLYIREKNSFLFNSKHHKGKSLNNLFNFIESFFTLNWIMYY